jgi:phenylalanyl-tRNA synthetase alpha chain
MEYTHKNLSKIETSFNKDLENLTYAELREKYLGKKGSVTEALREIANISHEQKPIYGKEVNALKTLVEENLSEKIQQNREYTSQPKIDPTAPLDINEDPQIYSEMLSLKGSKHPLNKEIKKLLNIFSSMGFDILESRQIDDDYNMFQSLNFPKGHPARDMYDTFRTEEGLVLPAHTSTMQNRALKKFGPPPIAVVLPGRCFRNEATDAGHEHTFHQIEGVYVDKKVSLSNMIAIIKAYLERYLETDLKIKIQPAYFPFTEPDCEFVIGCPFCNMTGCSTCGHSGWIEIMGCGMIHPNVLKEADIDPEVYSGFAWGFGVDRLAMIKLGIDDIRHLRESNLNFLRQF